MLASDVFESGAQVDTLLFGSLIGLTDRDLWLTAAVAVVAVVLDAGLRRHWLAGGFEPGSARALGLRPVLADRLLLMGVGAAAIVALDAVGALLVTVVLVVPAATVRLLTDRLGVLQAGAIALALVEGVAAVWLADALNVGAGPALAVIGGAGFALVAARHGVRADGRCRHERARGPRARRRLRARPRGAARRRLRRGAGSDRRRPRPERRRQDDALPRAARRAAGPARRRSSLPGRPAYVPQTDEARLDFPVSAFDVALMGAFAPDAVVPAGGARGPRARRTPRSTASGSPTAPGRRSARSPAASASAC